VPTVQRRTATVLSGALTVLALLVVIAALLVPDRLEDVTPIAFLRLPVELLVLLAVVLALPEHLRGVRRLVVAAAALTLALVTVLKALDIGFVEALNRPFDPLVDWRYTPDLAVM